MKIWIVILLLTYTHYSKGVCWPQTYQRGYTQTPYNPSLISLEPEISFCVPEEMNDSILKIRVQNTVNRIGNYIKKRLLVTSDQYNCDVTIKFLKLKDQGIYGFFAPSENLIVLDIFKLFNDLTFHKVLVHEILHSLGYQHNHLSPETSIMSQFLNPTREWLIFPQDIIALQMIYGATSNFKPMTCEKGISGVLAEAKTFNKTLTMAPLEMIPQDALILRFNE